MTRVWGQHGESDSPINTKWRPVDLACLDRNRDLNDGDPDPPADEPAEEIIVRTKLVRGPDSAAMCVSESVGLEVLQALDVPVAKAFSVVVSDAFAEDLTEQYEYDRPVRAGPHWGTRTLFDAIDGVLSGEMVDQIENPINAVRIYIADVLLAYGDRDTHGNVLFVAQSRSDAFKTIPIDQSDCFTGPDCLRNEECLEELHGQSIADHPEGMERVIHDRGGEVVGDEIRRARQRRDQILAASEAGEEEWYERSGIDPMAVAEFLDRRLADLDQLARRDFWQRMAAAAEGGHVLDL